MAKTGRDESCLKWRAYYLVFWSLWNSICQPPKTTAVTSHSGKSALYLEKVFFLQWLNPVSHFTDTYEMNLCKYQDDVRFCLGLTMIKQFRFQPQNPIHFQHFAGDIRESGHNSLSSANQTLNFTAVTFSHERPSLLKRMQYLPATTLYCDSASWKSSQKKVSFQKTYQ